MKKARFCCFLSRLATRLLLLTFAFYLFFLSFGAKPALAQPNTPGLSEVFVDNEAGFEYSIPEDYLQIDPPSAQVRLIVSKRDRSFPNLNVVMMPGPFVPEQTSETKVKEKLIEQYRLSGLINSSVSTISNIENGWLVRAEYELRNELFVVFVRIINRLASHLIVTITVRKDQSTEMLKGGEIDDLFSRLSLIQNEVDTPKHTDLGQVESRLGWLVIIVCLLVAIVAAVAIHRMKSI